MSKVPLSGLLTLFHRMLDQHWTYGADTREGNVDCSGAFVYAYGQYGLSLYHGSNRIARTKVVQLYPVGSVTPKPGMAAFKARQVLEAGYALPASYQPGGANYNGDLQDYYHIGLVDTDTSRVLNAQSTATGFVSSKLSAGWDYLAYLTDVDYGEELVTVAIETANVVGGKLNLRATPSKTGTFLVSIPEGATVTVLDKSDAAWWQVSYGGKTGYAMAMYLSGEGGVSSTTTVSITLTRDVAVAVKAALTSAGV